MKYTKKVLALLLAMTFILSVIPLQAVATGDIPDTYGDYLCFTYDDHIEIVRYLGNATDLIVPETLGDDKPVTVIRQNAFSDASQLQSVDLSQTQVVSIGKAAFKYLQLTSVSFPETLQTIGESAFDSCYYLQVANLSETALTEIGTKAFYDCGQLTTVTVPSTLTSIGNAAFYSCDVLASFTFPSALSALGVSAFSSCPELVTADLSGTQITELAEGTFSGCSSLETVVLPDSLTSIGNNAFRGDTSLSVITWPQNSNFKTINGFAGCVSLTDDVFASIPDSVTAIGDEAFTGCEFTEISIPSNIKTIGDLAFNACESIETLTFEPGVQSIGRQAFEGCFGLAGKLIDIPETVTYIGCSAFGYITSDDEGITEPFTLVIRNRDLSLVPENTSEEVCLYDENSENPLLDIFDFTEYANVYAYETDSNGLPSDIKTMFDRKLAEGSFTGTFNDLASGDPVVPVVSLNHKIRVNMKKGVVPFRSFDGIDFTVSAGGTVLTEGTDYTVEYPYIVLDKDIAQDEVITLTAVPSEELMLTGGFATGTKETANFTEIELVPWGHALITLNSTFAGANTVLIFDSDGKLVEYGYAADQYMTTNLPAGNYTAVVYNKNKLFSTFASLSQVAALGLTEGTDYVLTAFSVADNEETKPTIDVPVLDTAQLSSILTATGNSVVLSSQKVELGKNVCAQIHYSLKSAPSVSAEINIQLPEGIAFSGVFDETTKLTAEPAGNTLTLSLEKQSGTFYVYFSATTGGDKSLSVSATDSGVTAPVGTAAFNVKVIRVDTGSSWLTSRDGTVVIYTNPNTSFTVELPDGSQRNLHTNAAGRATVQYTLPETAISGDRFTITANVLTNFGLERVYDSADVTYMPSNTQVKNFFFVHAGKRTDLVTNGVRKTNAFYTYFTHGGEELKYWSFGATLTSPVELDENMPVEVVVVTMADTTRTTDMACVSKTAVDGGYEYEYAGEMYIDQAGDHIFDSSLIPCEFEILFEDQLQKIDADAAFEKAWNYAMDWQDQMQNLCNDADCFNPEIAGALLSGSYKVSGEDWFADLPDDIKADVLAAEDMLEDAAKEICIALKIPYDKVNEYLIPNENPDSPPSLNVNKVLENNGIHISQHDGFDTDALAAEGYTICTVPSKRRGPQQHVAIKETENGIHTICEEDGFELEVNYVENAEDNAVTGSKIDSLDTLATVTEDAAKKLEKAKVSPGNLKVIGQFASGAAVGAQLWDANNNIKEMGGVYSDVERLKGYIANRERWYSRYLELQVSQRCLASMRAEIRAAKDLLSYLENHAGCLERDIAIGLTLCIVGVATGGIGFAVLSVTLGYTLNQASITRASMLEIYVHNLNMESARVMRDCEDEEEEALKRARNGMRVTPILDPSGVVYEAIESNALEGVTATVWYDDDTDHTDGVIQWDAAAYDQVNPQITAKDGAFAWDVPQGYWQVRFTKDGYEDTATEWMEVPPPRMNLAVPMVSTEAPAVVSANAYKDYIEVIFSQYMDKTAVLTLPDGMTGEWQGTDTYSKVLHITKDGGFTKGQQVALTISGAKNYAGTALPNYSATLRVGARPAEIILNYESVVAMKAGATPNVTVRVKDSDGKYMSGVTLDAVIGNDLLATIDASAVTDETGKAVFAANALLPGLTDITVSVHGTTLKKTLDLRITADDNKPLRPTAVVGDVEFTAASPKQNEVTVDYGSTFVINAEPGVTIYYTTDDTCPCQNSASRHEYTGPITLTKDTYYRIAAYKDGMMYSDRINIDIKVRLSDAENAAIDDLRDASIATIAQLDSVVDEDKYTPSSYAVYKAAYDNFKETTLKENDRDSLGAIREARSAVTRAYLGLVLRTNIKSATVDSISAMKYTGKALTPAPVVKLNDKVLVKGTDYTVSYKNNKNAGTATVTITGTGDFTGTTSTTFKINKIANPMTAKAKKSSFTLSLSKVKSAAQTVATPITVSKAQGTVTYKKSSGSANITVDSKTGKLTVKKGTAKGTYTIKVQVKAAGNTNYNAATKTVTLKVVVK